MSIQLLEGIAVGLVTGVFIPGVLRKVKAFFVKEADAFKTDVKSEASAVEKKL